MSIGIVELAFNITIEEDTKENRAYFSTALNSLHSTVTQSQKNMWNISNNRRVIEVFEKIVFFYESKGGSKLLDLGSANFQLALEIIQAFYSSNKDFLRIADIH